MNNTAHALAPLRERRERPCRGAAEQRHELRFVVAEEFEIVREFIEMETGKGADAKRADLHVRCGLLLTHLFNRGRPVLFEVGRQCQEKIFVERPTRSLQGPARVS
jgi:hypothetical protein